MRHAPLALLLLASLGCDSSSAPPAGDAAPAPAGAEAAAEPTPAAPAPSEVAAAAPAPAAVATTLDDACSKAALGLPPDTVVATVGGEPLLAEALGANARDAERDALHTYCREVHRIRESTTRRAIDDQLLAKAAAAAGTTTDQLLRTTIDAKVTPPTDEEIAAFYEKNRSEKTPPLELVKDQVSEAIVKERSQAAFTAFIGSLRADADIQLKLPDVRPPAQDLQAADHSATFGPKDAKLTIVEFSDFECPYCSKAAEGVAAVKERFGDQVHFAYRHFPLSFHPGARPAAEYSQCANEQGKFWAMHDEIFANQRSLDPEHLRTMAKDVGVDLGKLDECLASGRAAKQVEEDMAKAQQVGVRGTPSMYFNGRTYEGGTGPEDLVAAVEAELRGS